MIYILKTEPRRRPTLPRGLFGLLRKITFVFSLNLLANSSGSSFQSALDRVFFPVTSCPTETYCGMKVHVLSIANISPIVLKFCILLDSAKITKLTGDCVNSCSWFICRVDLRDLIPWSLRQMTHGIVESHFNFTGSTSSK